MSWPHLSSRFDDDADSVLPVPVPEAARGEVDVPAFVLSVLGAEERILWVGAPDPRRVLVPRDVVVIPFTLIWGAGFGFGGVVFITTVPLPFGLLGLAMLAAAAYAVFGRLLVTFWRRARTRYVLTDRRAIIASTWPATTIRSIDLRRAPVMSITTRRDGSGTLAFGESAASSGRYSTAGEMRQMGNAFVDIPDVANVQEIAAIAAREPR